MVTAAPVASTPLRTVRRSKVLFAIGVYRSIRVAGRRTRTRRCVTTARIRSRSLKPGRLERRRQRVQHAPVHVPLFVTDGVRVVLAHEALGDRDALAGGHAQRRARRRRLPRRSCRWGRPAGRCRWCGTFRSRRSSPAAAPAGPCSAWQAAHERAVRCTSSRWRFVIGTFVGWSTTAVLTPGGGGGMVRHISASRMNFPRKRGRARIAGSRTPTAARPCSASPPRGPSAGSDIVWKVVEVRPGRIEAVEPREIRVHDHLRGREQVDRRSPDRRTPATPRCRACRGPSPPAGRSLYSGNSAGSFACVAIRSSRMYSSAKAPTDSRPAGRVEHPRRGGADPVGRRQHPARRLIHQRLVGKAVPDQEREPGRHLVAREAEARRSKPPRRAPGDRGSSVTSNSATVAQRAPSTALPKVVDGAGGERHEADRAPRSSSGRRHARSPSFWMKPRTQVSLLCPVGVQPMNWARFVASDEHRVDGVLDRPCCTARRPDRTSRRWRRRCSRSSRCKLSASSSLTLTSYAEHVLARRCGTAFASSGAAARPRARTPAGSDRSSRRRACRRRRPSRRSRRSPPWRLCRRCPKGCRPGPWRCRSPASRFRQLPRGCSRPDRESPASAQWCPYTPQRTRARFRRRRTRTASSSLFSGRARAPAPTVRFGRHAANRLLRGRTILLRKLTNRRPRDLRVSAPSSRRRPMPQGGADVPMTTMDRAQQSRRGGGVRNRSRIPERRKDRTS